MSGLTRRQLLMGAAIGSTAWFLPGMSAAAVQRQDWRVNVLMRERVLRLTRPNAKGKSETSDFCYWRPQSGWDNRGYQQACHLLRDVEYGQRIDIDPHLLDVLFIMQTWLAYYGKPHDIRILSGYRTPEHNGSLEGAAKNSLHMQGRAADIHIPGMSTRVLADMGRMISVGGVGMYPDRGFIHVDTGPIRTWVGR